MFGFIQNSDGTCQLGVFPTTDIPDPLGFRSVVVDYPPPTFNVQHFVRILGPVPPTDTTDIVTELYCQTNRGLTLSCSVDDPTGGATQNVLQLDGDTLTIAATLQDGNTAATFTLVQAL